MRNLSHHLGKLKTKRPHLLSRNNATFFTAVLLLLPLLANAGVHRRAGREDAPSQDLCRARGRPGGVTPPPVTVRLSTGGEEPSAPAGHGPGGGGGGQVSSTGLPPSLPLLRSRVCVLRLSSRDDTNKLAFTWMFQDTRRRPAFTEPERHPPRRRHKRRRPLRSTTDS